MSEPNDFNRSMEEAFPAEEARALMPAGPQQITIDDRPRGAMKLEVRRDPPGIILRDLKQLAQAAGDDFFYRWPVKAKMRDENGKEYWGTDWVEGPSVKCAMAVARRYGNCQVRVRAFDQGNHWMLHALFYDAETGYTLERPFQQRKSQNVGEKMNADRAMDLVFQIGTSKATRNVIVNGVPEFVNYAFLEAKGAIVAKIEGKPDIYKARIRQRLDELKVDVKRVEMRHGRTSDKWLVPDMASIIAEIQSVNDGMADADEMWPNTAAIELPQDRPREENYRTSDEGEKIIAGEPGQGSSRGIAADGDGKSTDGATGAGSNPASPSPLNETAKSNMGQNGENPTGEKPKEPALATAVAGESAQNPEEVPARPDPIAEALQMLDEAEQAWAHPATGEEIERTPESLAGYRKAIHANIDAMPGLSGEERARLHGSWNGVTMGWQRQLETEAKRRTKR